jgi:hypothetical protein
MGKIIPVWIETMGWICFNGTIMEVAWIGKVP